MFINLSHNRQQRANILKDAKGSNKCKLHCFYTFFSCNLLRPGNDGFTPEHKQSAKLMIACDNHLCELVLDSASAMQI